MQSLDCVKTGVRGKFAAANYSGDGKASGFRRFYNIETRLKNKDEITIKKT